MSGAPSGHSAADAGPIGRRTNEDDLLDLPFHEGGLLLDNEDMFQAFAKRSSRHDRADRRGRAATAAAPARQLVDPQTHRSSSSTPRAHLSDGDDPHPLPARRPSGDRADWTGRRPSASSRWQRTPSPASEAPGCRIRVPCRKLIIRRPNEAREHGRRETAAALHGFRNRLKEPRSPRSGSRPPQRPKSHTHRHSPGEQSDVPTHQGEVACVGNRGRRSGVVIAQSEQYPTLLGCACRVAMADRIPGPVDARPFAYQRVKTPSTVRMGSVPMRWVPATAVAARPPLIPGRKRISCPSSADFARQSSVSTPASGTPGSATKPAVSMPSRRSASRCSTRSRTSAGVPVETRGRRLS